MGYTMDDKLDVVQIEAENKSMSESIELWKRMLKERSKLDVYIIDPWYIPAGIIKDENNVK